MLISLLLMVYGAVCGFILGRFVHEDITEQKRDVYKVLYLRELKENLSLENRLKIMKYFIKGYMGESNE